MAAPRPGARVSSALASLRWAFMPLGLLALVAVGVHAAADLVDDRLLRLVEWADAGLDGLWATWTATAKWVTAVDTAERTAIARGLALAWELAVDLFVALPMLGYAEEDEPRFSFRPKTWRALFTRVNQQPTPMRLVRPAVTAVFAVGAAYAVSRLVEGTLVVGLTGDVAAAAIAVVVARVAGGLALTLVLVQLGWRAVLRALEHADAACEDVEKTGARAWGVGLWGTALALPLALALVLEARALLSLFL